jgi:hypothetical protein
MNLEKTAPVLYDFEVSSSSVILYPPVPSHLPLVAGDSFTFTTVFLLFFTDTVL